MLAGFSCLALCFGMSFMFTSCSISKSAERRIECVLYHLLLDCRVLLLEVFHCGKVITTFPVLTGFKSLDQYCLQGGNHLRGAEGRW